MLTLMARGLSNAEIGRACFLGDGTVKTDVVRILAKIDLRGRVQAVVYGTAWSTQESPHGTDLAPIPGPRLRPSNRVHCGPDPGRLADPAVDAIAYRIVQEAQTNVARHAPGSEVSLRITVAPTSIEVLVDNDHSPHGPVEAVGGGQGLRGMAERVGDWGGHLEAGPTAAGGYRIHAVLPHTRRPNGALT